jgi:hypothetical protein
MRTFTVGVFVTLACALGGCAIGSGDPGESTGSIHHETAAGDPGAGSEESAGYAEEATGVQAQALKGFRLNDGTAANTNGDWQTGPQPIPWKPNATPSDNPSDPYPSGPNYHTERATK